MTRHGRMTSIFLFIVQKMFPGNPITSDEFLLKSAKGGSVVLRFNSCSSVHDVQMLQTS